MQYLRNFLPALGSEISNGVLEPFVRDGKG